MPTGFALDSAWTGIVSITAKLAAANTSKGFFMVGLLRS
jgi:hypothetical protein